jgi:hypothetical protein
MKWNEIIEKGRLHGPIPSGGQRVMVIECDAKITHHDFSNLEQARMYADDAASETCDHPPLAIVLDDEFRVVYRGRPYYTRSKDKSGPNIRLPDQQECCDKMNWEEAADLGYVSGVDLDLGRCKRCGTYVMAVFSYFHGTPVYVTVNPADAEKFISLLGRPHELRVALKDWLER